MAISSSPIATLLSVGLSTLGSLSICLVSAITTVSPFSVFPVIAFVSEAESLFKTSSSILILLLGLSLPKAPSFFKRCKNMYPSPFSTIDQSPTALAGNLYCLTCSSVIVIVFIFSFILVLLCRLYYHNSIKSATFILGFFRFYYSKILRFFLHFFVLTLRRHSPIRLPTISWIMSVLGGAPYRNFKIIFYLFFIKKPKKNIANIIQVC